MLRDDALGTKYTQSTHLTKHPGHRADVLSIFKLPCFVESDLLKLIRCQELKYELYKSCKLAKFIPAKVSMGNYKE